MAHSGKIIVTGATGNVGSAVLDNLGTIDGNLRALAHNESSARSLKDRGVEAVVGDFLEPETLVPALEGVSTVLLITPIHPEKVTQASNVIKAAKDSGNDPRIVRLSVDQASHEAPSRNSRQHAQIEDQLRSSGLPYTLLGPTTFMQNTLTTHDKEGQTKYWRIRAFDKVAERVRDTVRKGQKDVEAVVYGPKQWTQKKKTDTGWTQETVQGYYAGMVRVPDK